MSIRGPLSGSLLSRSRALALAVALGVVAAGCGGAQGKATAKRGSQEQSVVNETTTTTAATDTTAITGDSSTTTTAAARPGATTATTRRATTATTRKNAATGATTPANVVAPRAGGIGNVSSATSAPSVEAQPGGQVTWLKQGEIPGLDPLVMTGSGASDGPQGIAVYDVLVYSDAGVVKGQTVESLTSSDAIVWTMKLRPNIMFSDGTPYDAAAVKFNFDRFADPANKATRAGFAQSMATKEIVDPTTLRITLKTKNAVFPAGLTLMPFVASPKAIQEKGSKLNNEPVGAGPYVMKSWTRDDKIVFERNPNYWNAPLPYLDRITMKSVVDESQRANTFCTGDAQISYGGSVQKSDETIKRNCGAVKPFILNGGSVLYMNVKTKPFNDSRLREAVTRAIDMDDYSKVVDNGLIAPNRSMFRTDSPFYDPNILQNAYDPVKAQQLFDAVAKDNGGTIEWTMTTFAGLPQYATPSEYFAGKFNTYKNVKVTLQPEAAATHLSRTTASDFTMSVYANIFDDPEPNFTSSLTCVGSPNYTGYCDPKFDALVQQEKESLDPNQRIATIKQMQQVFYAAAPAWFFESRYSWVFTVNNLQDFKYVNDGLPMLDRFWLKTR